MFVKRVRYWVSSLVLITLFVVDLGLQFVNPFYQQSFIEQNPDLSLPYQTPPAVSRSVLYMLALALPAVTTPFVCMKMSKRKRLFVVLYFCFSLCSADLLATCLKYTFGEPRPNFFAYCNYYGYREALETGNYTDYLQNTKFGRIGNVSGCQSSQKDINDAFISWPSDYATLLFTSATASLLIATSSTHITHCTWCLSVLNTGSILTLVVWVSLTRVQEHWHRPSEIFCGSMLGICNALWWAWLFFRTNRQARRPPTDQQLLNESPISQTQD